MAEIDEQMHRGWTKLSAGNEVGWDTAAMNSVDAMYPEGTTESEREFRQVKIEHVGNFMRKVVSLPLEPVVFYRPGYAAKIANDKVHFFHVVTPDLKKPVEFMVPTDESELSAVLRLNSMSREVGTFAMHTVHADFDTTVNTELNPNVKVWFGIGADHTSISPDLAYDNRDLGVRVAIGSKESGELFSSLRTDDSIRNGRLFGSMFDIAWMAHDLGIKPTNLGDFSAEKTAALGAVHIKRSAAASSLKSAKKVFELIQEASVETANQDDIIKSTRTMYKDSIGDVYIRDMYPNREIADDASVLYARTIDSLGSSVRAHQVSMARKQEAIAAYDKQLAILNSIVN